MNVIKECRRALKRVDQAQIDRTVEVLREAERIFCVGNGGGYAHAMHFASDLRKIAQKQAFSFDNLAEYSARINDDGWADAVTTWRNSHGYSRRDLTFMFSVGGGLDGLSPNLPNATFGIVGQNGSDILLHERIVIPSTSTPVVEGCQSVIAHHLVEQLCK